MVSYELVFIGLFFSYLLLFLLSIYMRDNSIVDIFWGLGFIQIIVHTFLIRHTHFPEVIQWFELLLLLLVIIWGLRLSLQVLYKRIVKGGEDPRYRAYRNMWTYFYTRSFFQIFMLQLFIAFIIASPLLYILSATHHQISFNLVLIGGTISLIGLLYETIADFQLSKFKRKKNSKDEILNTGLWKFSRHPNYLGEFTFWLGIAFIGWFINPIASILSIVTIFVLLRFVSGVPLAEVPFLENKEYEKYMKTTPAFFPKFFSLRRN